MLIANGKSNCFVFRGRSVSELLLEIVDYISKNPGNLIESSLQDMTVIFENDLQEYVATIYLDIQCGE